MQFSATPGGVALSVVVDVPSPLLAEGPGCGSPPLLAGVRWWSWCVVHRHSWLRVLVAVPRHSWIGSAGSVGCFVGVRGVPCCVCLWRGRLRVVFVLLCVFCVFGVCVGGGVVWMCLPRALVCVRACA